MMNRNSYGTESVVEASLTYEQRINKEMVTAAINPNLSSKYLLAGGHISAPDSSITTQLFKAENHF